MTAPWWEAPAVSFDTESTGVNVLRDRIVTIALVSLGDGKPTRESYLVNPGVPIPAEATAIHGITTEQAIAKGCMPPDALDVTAGALALALSKGMPVIGMNIVYDLSLLHAECVRHRVETVSSRLGGHDRLRPVVDALVMDKHVSFRRGSRRLGDLCAHYGIKHHGAHDSGYDALAAAMVAAEIAKRYPTVSALSLDELHAAQVGWKAEQNSSFESYKRRQPGGEGFTVDTGWPLYDKVLTAGEPS